MGMIAILFGLACAAVLAFCALTMRATRQADSTLLALMLCVSWMISNLLVTRFSFDAAFEVFPYVDAFAVAITMILWLRNPTWWKMVLAIVLETKAVLHVMHALPYPPSFYDYNYVVAINAIFALELVCVSFPGGQIVADRFRDWMSDRRSLVDHGLRAGREGAP